MSDSDRASTAWRLAPADYVARREVACRLPEAPSSRYVTMSDGCRLAVDVYLPEAADGRNGPRPVPAIVLFTPYYRRFRLKPGAEGTEPSPNAGKYRDFFVPRGYALVVVDVRGTGASFGTRDSFRSPREREDYREIADWIVAQDWSDGAIGATGVSYLGAACDFLASTGHPAVKAIAPLFAVWDTYSDHYYPGGLLLNQLAKTYDELMVALDHDRRDLLAQFAYFRDPGLDGPQPVDEDADGSLARAAVAEHLANFRMPSFITEFRFKDDALPYDPDFTSAAFSPYRYRDGIAPDVAVLSVSGWMDGAGYANGSISRFLTLDGNPGELLLGPWDHGARVNVSPRRETADSQFALLGAVLRFFDEHLMGRDTGAGAENRVHYFTMNDERWRSAKQWPPFEETAIFHLGDGVLAETEQEDGVDAYQTDFSLGTGHRTRYERIAGLDTRDYYTDWQGRDAAMLNYTSQPLAGDAELTGHAVVKLWLSSSEPDAALHVYLSDVEEDGTVRYVTEGVLRALHRRERPAPAHHRTSWPYRSFTREDARPLEPGRMELFRFAFLPTSWMFHAGSRIRLSIAGADADHFEHTPHGRPPLLSVGRGKTHPSRLVLPLRPAPADA
ncbi:CocE/NonD family hydrolase [Kaustia mangrovi]|uniref:CocE/NonD family hydrolase n=1 Tax=Kaustia mangrovi TaxID=2593653 RepID=A0A7S8C3C7_9HYPH|nr:CocE/NonD family hydrolase [Kaustia mangrovi]QPC42638.1 CocE/NonD family hydrolase [Kaustia mangrovi]